MEVSFHVTTRHSDVVAVLHVIDTDIVEEITVSTVREDRVTIEEILGDLHHMAVVVEVAIMAMIMVTMKVHRVVQGHTICIHHAIGLTRGLRETHILEENRATIDTRETTIML